jgi:proteasome lid subunit RPN8/RPN11
LGILEKSLPEIYRLGLTRYPAEACGLLVDVPRRLHTGDLTHVIELPNRSLAANGQYVVLPGDIELALRDYDEIEEAAIWHTHPSGYIGPSEGDKAHRPTADVHMVVVALTPEGPVATWF